MYKPRGINALQFLFKKHFQSFVDQYEATNAIIHGRFRIERITEVVEKFVLCGDYSQGVARIQCTNPDCKYEYFRPFSCKSFYFCPPCSQKRTLLFSQYMNERLLLALPHRQFVLIFPKLLRPYFRHSRRLFSEVSQLIFAILQRFYDKAARRPVRTGMVLAYCRTSGEFLRWNPHFPCFVLEGGFDDRGKFCPYPRRRYPADVVQFLLRRNCLADWLQPICTSTFRRAIIKLFLKRELISARIATSLINWEHSGFSLDNWIRVPAFSIRAREVLSQYIARPPLSLKKIGIEENGEATAVSFTSHSEFFKGKTETFPLMRFFLEPTQLIPPKGCPCRHHTLRRRRGLDPPRKDPKRQTVTSGAFSMISVVVPDLAMGSDKSRAEAPSRRDFVGCLPGGAATHRGRKYTEGPGKRTSTR